MDPPETLEALNPKTVSEHTPSLALSSVGDAVDVLVYKRLERERPESTPVPRVEFVLKFYPVQPDIVEARAQGFHHHQHPERETCPRGEGKEEPLKEEEEEEEEEEEGHPPQTSASRARIKCVSPP